MQDTRCKMQKSINMAYKILVVDDESSVRYSFHRLLKDSEYLIDEAIDGKEVIKKVKDEDYDLVVMDIQMPKMNGLEVLKEIKLLKPKLLVILVTAFGTTDTAIEAMKFGAYDYLLKPFDVLKLKETIKKALEVSYLMKTQVVIETESFDRAKEKIVGSSLKMQEIYKLIGRVATSDVTVLIRGESGTGKELVARAIYQHSKRNDKSFLAVNCAAIPENLLESELFGYEKGAFTGAHQKRIGKFEQCDGGTIFLDEIGDMTPSTQTKILRVLQEGTFERLGGNETIKINVRIITATNKNLEEEIKNKNFREDLYYRLRVVTIEIPPLKERKEDIPQLTSYFISKSALELKREPVMISQEALQSLIEYDWPGNVRELENVIKNSFVLSKGNVILPETLSFAVNKKLEEEQFVSEFFPFTENDIKKFEGDIMEKVISEVEKRLIIFALKQTGGNQVQASKLLGISRVMLRDRIDKYNIKSEVKIIEENM
jgi:two-component system nitrogen regulation response regulator GlnG